MAKRGRSKTGLNAAAEGIGTGLGRLAAKYDALVKRRDSLARELRDYVKHAEQLLGNLGHTAAIRVNRTEKQAAKAAKQVKRRFSPAARAKLRASAKARWAAAKKAGKASLG
jgi:ElaB/YqjD/DUF883 family membrane-anchored ribosome-binding protein